MALNPSGLLTASLQGARHLQQPPLKRPRPQVYRIRLETAEAAAKNGAAGALFNVNFPGELGLDPERHYMLAVEYCHVDNMADPRSWFEVHLDGLMCPNLASARQTSDIIHVQYGEGYNAGAICESTLGIPITDRSMFRSKTLRVYFTDSAGAPLDLTGGIQQWVVGLIIWEWR